MTLYFSRRHPKWEWVRITFNTNIEPGHHWHYNGLVRRDTFSVRGVGLVLQRLIKARAVEHAKEWLRSNSTRFTDQQIGSLQGKPGDSPHMSTVLAISYPFSADRGRRTGVAVMHSACEPGARGQLSRPLKQKLKGIGR